MNQNTTPATNPSVSPDLPPAKKRRSWLLFGCGGVIALLLVIVAAVAITLWWSQRPMKPVTLSGAEKTKLEQKLQHLGSAGSDLAPRTPSDPVYVPGTNVILLTDREINGLINENTDLGKAVRLEFGRDAINAYLATPIPEDVPVLGGKMFRARGRLSVSLGQGKAPVAVLEDLTVYGVSLPKAWLGGLKGENLLSEAMGQTNGTLFKGVKSLRIEPGVLKLELEN